MQKRNFLMFLQKQKSIEKKKCKIIYTFVPTSQCFLNVSIEYYEKSISSASSRGAADHGWLQAKHSFSFANYYDSERVQFGALRVLNDDIIAPGMGFGTHPHDNMEIITIPLDGALEHKDSMDNIGVIETDEIQVMSAEVGLSQ